MKKIFIYIVIILFATQSVFAVSDLESTNNSSRIGCFKFITDLKFGDGFSLKNRDKVKELQQTLHDAGYLKSKVDGRFGIKTKNALKLYQKDNNLKQTGSINEETRGILRSNFCAIENSKVTDNCKIWSDGCNTCSRGSVGAPGMCTLMACIVKDGEKEPEPYCKEYFTSLIKDCPTEKIIDRMPVMCIKAPCPDVERSYYIYKGERKEISDFDTDWVKNNCSVKENIVY